MSGSSPCTFTTTAGRGESWRAASATRSVPVRAGPVRSARAPAARAASAMRASSVATATQVHAARSQGTLHHVG